MASRHYTSTAYAVHLFGELPWQHQWKVYGTEAVAKVQAVRMEEEYAHWGAQAEIFPLEGQGAEA